MFMVTGTSINIWMLTVTVGSSLPNFGSNIYVDDTNNHYVDPAADDYQDGYPT